MADVEERRPETEEVAEAGLKAIATGDILADNGMPYEVANGNSNGNGHGLHQNGDTDMSDVSEILEFDEIGSNFVETNYGMNEVETGESSKHVGEVVEEETVELEFEKVKPKLATHSMHCPNCKSEVTKVILRRKLWSKSKPEPKPEPLPELEPQPEPEPEPESEPEQETKLVGCLACLSLFTRSDNGNLKLFDIFPKRQEPSVSTVASSSLGKAKPEAGENDSCFSLFWVIGSDKTGPNLKDDGQPRPVSSETTPTGTISQVPRSNLPLSTTDVTQNDPNTTRIDIPSDQIEVVAQPSGRTWFGYEGVLAEILKSIVYGGLMEVIASLSVVASAAASDAATLSIISLALASVIGGVFVIGHNLWDLRDDCHKAISSQETNSEAATKYKELLGQVNYFPLHAFFATLSFLVFGIVPPVAYGFSFHETNDKDFTLVVVASASLLCVLALATFKAYINRCNAFGYLKTLVYYITTAVSVSGVSYVVGDLVSRLMEEYGLFDPNSSILPRDTTQSLAYF